MTQLSLTDVTRTAVLALLRGYKWAVSPLLPPACRYLPTCSEYAAESIERHGVFRGSALAAWRLLRCHPFVRGGYDPVPLSGAAPETLVRGPAITLASTRPENIHSHPSH